ncbi:hypothetical protein [Paracoccus sp. (in: a-proteobacteria)]|uniref:hypothetical protein n=1 Tax=Paracoccus sp. TaxID=267 RepID=UPI0028A64813|nr:hypothetical protein [Paracoccus sp. (in: a-proteobacteria)]
MADDNVVEFQRRPINEWPKELFIADIEDGGGVRVYDHIQHPDDSTPRYIRADLHDAPTKQRDELAAEVDQMAHVAGGWKFMACQMEAERDAALAKAGAMREVAASEHAKAEALRVERDAALAREAAAVETVAGEASHWVSLGENPAELPELLRAMHRTDAQAALDKLIADARADETRACARICTRGDDTAAILARINEPQEGGSHD